MDILCDKEMKVSNDYRPRAIGFQENTGHTEIGIRIGNEEIEVGVPV